MAVIDRNEHGAIALNNKVLSKIIIEELLHMQSLIILCNKKGKIIKENPTPFLDPDYYDSVEVSETTKGGMQVNIYLISRIGTNISDLSNNIFSRVESCFELFRLKKPDLINIYYKGIISNYKSKKKIKVMKRNS